MHALIMLAQRHVRAVLLGPADRNDDRRLAGSDLVAKLGPGQLLKKHCGRLGARGRQADKEKAQDEQCSDRCTLFPWRRPARAHLLVIHPVNSARSSSVMPVSLPSGICFSCTTWTMMR